jgi:4-hydroxythreonine-4-phosphate dehydrogenase
VWLRAGWRQKDGPIIDTQLGLMSPKPGRPTAAGGKIAAAAFEESLRLCVRGVCVGVVTAPISKIHWETAGYPYRDHTERLSQFSISGEVDMILGLPSKNIWCAVATRHVPLKEAIQRIDKKSISSATHALNQALRLLGKFQPKIALCGLNPHAGENGLIGTEEIKILRPAVAGLNRVGLPLEGPLPADSAWRLHEQGVYEGLVCLYHDQALIPLKVLGGLSGVNWTIGLPFIRVSPAHGTGWEAARSGVIDASGTIEAARLAVRLMN